MSDNLVDDRILHSRRAPHPNPLLAGGGEGVTRAGGEVQTPRPVYGKRVPGAERRAGGGPPPPPTGPPPPPRRRRRPPPPRPGAAPPPPLPPPAPPPPPP